MTDQVKRTSASLQTLMYVLLGIGAIAAIVVQAFYWGWIFPGDKKADWGQFGDYIGGSLNPILSFLTFVGLVITVILQARTLEMVREQSALEELQRLQATVAARIDSLLEAKPAPGTEMEVRLLASVGDPKSLMALITALGIMVVHADDSFVEAAWPEKSERRGALSNLIIPLRIELNSLSWALEQYEREGGSSSVLYFYRHRFGALILFLDELGMLDTYKRVHRAFRTDLLRKTLDPDFQDTDD